MEKTRIAVCGAGIAGIATAHYLSTQYPDNCVVLIDARQPMSFTTRTSGENFRDYWPQACMSGFIGHSIGLMQGLADEHEDIFNMRYTGYDFVSEHREHEVFPSGHLRDPAQSINLEQITVGLDVSHPYLSARIRQLVHIVRAGAIDVYALGSLLLSRARKAGTEFCSGEVSDIEPGAHGGFRLSLEPGGGPRYVEADKVVLATGPFINDLAGKLGIRLTLRSYLQRKFMIPDPDGVVPRTMPFTVFADAQYLEWTDEERTLIENDSEYQWLLREFPPGLHIKPVSGGQIMLGWACNREPEQPTWEHQDDFTFPNIVLRGAGRFIPGLNKYAENPPTPVIQHAGYYTRTRENWPVIGPLNDQGVFAVAALSGFGTMAACSAGELCARWVMDNPLPDWARHFHPDRYEDPAVMAEIAQIESDGQL